MHETVNARSAILDGPWLVAGQQEFHSRVLVGLELYGNPGLVRPILESAGSEVFIITLDLEGAHASLSVSDLDIQRDEYIWIGTTSFAHTAEDAVRTARMLRSSYGIDVMKVDVRDARNFPDTAATLQACDSLLDDGFFVLPFIVPETASRNSWNAWDAPRFASWRHR